MMFQRLVFLLFFSHTIPLILSHEEDTTNPIDVLQVKHIRIKDYNGPLSKDMMALLKNVEVLEVRECNFTELHGNVLQALPNLRKFSSANNKILNKVHDVTSCCKKLKKMEFINSGISPIPWANFDENWPLETLHFIHEKSPELKPNFLSNKNLKHLTVEHSDVEKIDEGAFNKIEHLEYLNLQSNKIKKITKETFAPLKHLKVLNLSKNLLEDLTDDRIPSLPNLEKLDIGHNPIKKIDIVAMKKKMPKLTILDVSGIENIDVSKLGNLEDLTLVKQAIL